VQVTERYTHLRSDHFTDHDFRSMLGLATDELEPARKRRGARGA
jgi:hypothetical protein